MAEDETARTTYSILESEPGRWERARRLAVALTIGVFTDGAGPTNAGGRRLEIVELATGRTVAVYSEQMFDESRSFAGQVHKDLDRLSASEFADRWIPDDDDDG